jgi:hypothetical protein
LEGEFASVAEDEDRNLAIDGLQLLESGEDEDRSFTVPRFRLAQDVHPEDGLGNTLLLD